MKQKITLWFNKFEKYIPICDFIAINLVIVYIGVLSGAYFNNGYDSAIIRLLAIKQKEIDGVINTIWQVQSGVTTLTIATLALVVSMNKEKKYGFKVLTFLFVIKPFLKFHEKIILSIVLLFISYFFVAFQALASVVFIFLVSVILVILMVLECVKIILFEEKVDEELKTHLLERVRTTIKQENMQIEKEQ
ncbi:hypothetical protein ACDZ29_25455 [Peribacillus sp. RS7]|uniref:hypothetical protein n=1 Tax=Peribacillus sp. RS7 TaxID=3242679 RepID=UPI0035C1FC6E